MDCYACCLNWFPLYVLCLRGFVVGCWVWFAGVGLVLLRVGECWYCFSLVRAFVWCVNSVVYSHSFSGLFDTVNYLVFGALFSDCRID